MTKQVSGILVILATLCATAAGFWVARHLDEPDLQLTGGTWLAQPRRVSDFHLLDSRGQPYTLRDLQGRPSLVFFGFTHCPDVCPTTLAKLARAKKTLGTTVANLQVLFITVDPQRDTPEAVGGYAHAFDPNFVGVTGDPKELEKVMASFGVASLRVDLPGGDYTMDHSAAVFLLDTRARIVGVFTPPFDNLVQDLKTAAPHLGIH
jgi:protein SCO1/2